MFKWLKRQVGAPAASPTRAPARAAPARRQAAPPDPAAPFTPSLPLPEVVGEGNTQADWNAWEDSMTTLDSQLQDLMPSQRIHVRDTAPSQLDDLDPFSSVRGKRG